ncbi:MAG: sugar phosphate isomerase/epimerase family protein [Planctomycetaceae bacterium]
MRLSPAADSPADPYRGFKMGIQSYTLRAYPVERALELTRQLGLKYWEAYTNHLPVSAVPAKIAEQKKLAADSGVQILSVGVVTFDDNESKAREVFEFAKAIGLESISCDPNKEAATFKLLDKLVEEYHVNLGIHNHGPKSRYDKIDDVVNAVKDHHPRIGGCVDTGHYLRSREDPVEALERLQGRTFGVHLKDVKSATAFTILGEGDLNVVGCLKVLERLKYKHWLALEYEESKDNPIPDVEICLQNLRQAMQQLG